MCRPARRGATPCGVRRSAIRTAARFPEASPGFVRGVSKVGRLSDATVTHGGLQQFTMMGVGDALGRLADASDIARGCPDFDGYRQLLLGRSDAMVDPGVQPYDVCAPAVLVREAGGTFTSLSGEDTIYGGGAIASNGVIHDELVAALAIPAGD